MKKIYYIFFLSFIFLNYSFSQNTISVSPGDGTLKDAIANAKSGDILNLVPGGDYSESVLAYIPVNKKLTIQVDGPATSDKPKISIAKAGDATNVTNFFSLQGGGSITLIGLDFDGRISGTISASSLVKFDVGTIPAPISVGTIKVVNCTIHHLLKDVIEGQTTNYKNNVVVDSVIFRNCIINDVGPVIHFKIAVVKYIEVKNSTFYKFGIYGIRVLGATNTASNVCPNVVIDKVTIDNVLNGTKDFIDAEEQTGSWLITNSIFSNLNDPNTPATLKGLYWKNKEYNLYDSVALVTNCCLWKDGKRDFRLNAFKDTITMDPAYLDAANGDFTLPAKSVLLTMSKTKGPIGDPRWTKNAPQTAVEKTTSLPTDFSLSQNYPNPFNPSTTIKFALAKESKVELKIYNLLGKEVNQLVNGVLAAGNYSYDFNAAKLSSGVYFYKLNTGNFVSVKKMILMK
jgi:hypothetical protein